MTRALLCRALGLLGLLGCEGTITGVASPAHDAPGAAAGDDDEGPMSEGPATLPESPKELPPWGLSTVGVCENRPAGFSYQSVAATPLEAGRRNIAVGGDRARLKTYDSVDEIKREFDYGLDLAADIKGDALATFEARPRYEVPETRGGPLMIYAAFRFGFIGCLKAHRRGVVGTAFMRHADFATAPTPESARRQCGRFATRYWKRELLAEEADECAAAVLQLASLEPTVERQWASMCGLLAATADHLTY